MTGADETTGGASGDAAGAERADQMRVRQALQSGAPFGVKPADVEVIETHIAVVFLVGHCAYKMKKATALGYLNFVGLANRRAMLEKEHRLNKRTAPDLYRRVLPVTMETDGRLVLEGRGKPVEWLLEMVRFPQDALLRNWLEPEPGLALPSEGLAAPLGLAIRDLHASLGPCLTQGWARSLEGVVDNITGHLRDGIGPVLDRDAVDRYEARARTLLAELVGRLEERARAGYVRLCHGDLHTANIVVLDGRPVLFDCIEFNDTIACQDTLYDLSFLLMDCARRGRRDFGNRVFNAYLGGLDRADFSAALTGLAALPLYLGLRAAIRAHVCVAQIRGAAADGLSETAIATAIREARAYLALAERLSAPTGTRLVALGGLSGSGKSTVARDCADALPGPAGAVILRSDEIRKRAFGVRASEPLPSEAYQPQVSAMVYEMLAEEAATALRSGLSVIMDAVFARPAERDAAERVAAKAGVLFTGAWLEADPAIMAARIRGRRGDASDATEDTLRAQLDYDLGAMAWTRMDSGADRAANRLRLLEILGLPAS